MVRLRKATTSAPGPLIAPQTSHSLYGTAAASLGVKLKTSAVENKDGVSFEGPVAASKESKANSRLNKCHQKGVSRTTIMKLRSTKINEMPLNRQAKGSHNKNVNLFDYRAVKAPQKIENINTGFISSSLSTLPSNSIDTKLATNAWGETRFSRESARLKADAEMLLKAQVIDRDTAMKLSEPWHAKGILINPVWDVKHLDPSKIDRNTEVMSYEKAKKIQWRKDAQEKKFLEDWRTGLIDENGNPIKRKSELNVIRVEDGDGQIYAPKSKKPLPPATTMPSIIEDATSSLSESSTGRRSQPDPLPASNQARPRKSKTPQASACSLKLETVDYSSFNYYQLAAMCRERGLRSGGKTENLKNILITDDNHVKNGTDRENLMKNTLKKKRVYKTKAPVLEHSLGYNKRKRDEDEDRDQSGKKAKI
jgi:hypothetical protein